MAKDVFWTVTTFSIILIILVLAFWPGSKGHVIAYDCRIAEISPDIPLEVKEACRKRSNK